MVRLALYTVVTLLILTGPNFVQGQGIEYQTKKGNVDWLIDNSSFKSKVEVDEQKKELKITNGLVRRVFRLAPNAATVGFDNLVTGEAILRGVKPEGSVKIDDITYEIGGLTGQPNYAYLDPVWLDSMKTDPSAMQFSGYQISEPVAPFEWKRTRSFAKGSQWPPKGVHLRMDYIMPDPISLLNGGTLLPSDYRRTELYKTDFKQLDSTWNVTISKTHPRSSFENEGKAGEIYTPQNTAVYVEKGVDPETKIIEATFDVGTDKSKELGPGIALIWGDSTKTVKFYLRPGGNSYDDGVPMFGLWDGKKENKAAGGRQSLDISTPWTLRYRITHEAVYCEARKQGEDWRTIEKLAPFETMPQFVRIGKTNGRGQSLDAQNEGPLARLHVMDFASYGPLNIENEATNDNEVIGVSVHYELYDGIPVIAKWISVHNRGSKEITIDSFTSEILAAVEYGSAVETREYGVEKPNIHVETDYAFSSFNVDDANHHAVRWLPDPDYHTQVNYLRLTPCLLEVGPEIGPSKRLASGASFNSFRTFVMPYDSYQRERKGMALRKMYRTLAPWTTENPLMMHARFADWDRVKIAIDQAADVGFEMVILTFGSGFDIENDSDKYLAKMKKYADYAKSKGIQIGGYSLLASRKIGDKQDVVMPKGEKPTFGNSPCIGSEWGQQYFKKLYAFYEKTGFSLLEHDGSYPGDVCTADYHPGHRGLEDSRWEQYNTISQFYQWCRANGIYLNIPDYYYLTGGNKCGMGYREVNWSLPRAQQLIHTRQNIYDGAWQKTPSMGWMFVPLTEYQGGGAAATIEPLNVHLEHYKLMMISNLGAGVQACYRGPRLYDTEGTKSMVSEVINWYKDHREVLEGDIIHLRRADGRDIDYLLNVNPSGDEKGMLLVYNPLKEAVSRKIKVPLYYTGLTDKAMVQVAGGIAKEYTLDRAYSIETEVTVEGQGYTWVLIK